MVPLAALILAPVTARAQAFDRDAHGRVIWMMERLRDQMWTYRQELDFFQRAPEYQQLVDLRYRLRGLAVNLTQPFTDPRTQYGSAREMERAARDLYRLTRQLEGRVDLGAPGEVRRRADMLTEQAVEIRVLIGRLHEALRLDPEGQQYQPSQPPFGRPGDVR